MSHTDCKHDKCPLCGACDFDCECSTEERQDWLYENERQLGTLYTHKEYDDALWSIEHGTSSELMECPVDGHLTGIVATGHQSASARSFNAGIWAKLRCGHTIV